MSTLVAIGYPDETTAAEAAAEARRLARDLIIEPEAIAAISRDTEGRFHVSTSHHPVTGGASWGMFWGLLFGMLFFIPFFGMAVGAGLGALMGKGRQERHPQGLPGPGTRPAPAGHVGPVPGGQPRHS
nr:hypothetical protein GCM10020092_064120 [Actinoplanes digitatis]